MHENAEIKKLLAEISLQSDQAAYKKLFLLLHGRLLQFANSILRSEEDAKEVVSDVFMRLWEKRSQYHSIESPLLYLYTCVKNQALAKIARQKRREGAHCKTIQHFT
ncbi:MAG: hypothetical protein HC867_07425 [Bacteroidia bacterium]|nr:hypothetical protein [Bacteroidia bacterium]